MPEFTPEIAFAMKVHALYWQVIGSAQSRAAQPVPDAGLGGSLLYAGFLDDRGRALLIAGNISGCATLAVSSDSLAHKQAIRDGVIDFLVNSLDEALRILKNEIRQRKTVAVCVAAQPEAIEAEMLDRGVHPDLDRSAVESAPALDLGSPDRVLVSWQIASSPARWMPRLDNIALDYLAPDDFWHRRWLRLSPRYLGRPAQSFRLFWMPARSRSPFLREIREQVEKGEIAAPVAIQIVHQDRREQHQFTPAIPA